MSDTPETDAEKFFSEHHGYYVVFAEHAEDLERERDALKKHISIMEASRKIANNEYLKLAVENENLEIALHKTL